MSILSLFQLIDQYFLFLKPHAMKRILFFIFTTFFAFYSAAQVGIGTTTPRGALEVSNTTNGGILVPSYALTGDNDAVTVINPQGGALETGTLVYNSATVTGSNSLRDGFVYWDGSNWNRIMPKTEIMLRKFVAGGIGGSGSVFNFPSESFSNITGASYTGTSLTLPTGIYTIESEIRLNSNNTVDWAIRLDGSEIAGSVRGSTNPANFNTNASNVKQIAVFEITAASGVIDFTVSNGVGAAVLANQSYVKIERMN